MRSRLRYSRETFPLPFGHWYLERVRVGAATEWYCGEMMPYGYVRDLRLHPTRAMAEAAAVKLYRKRLWTLLGQIAFQERIQQRESKQ